MLAYTGEGVHRHLVAVCALEASGHLGRGVANEFLASEGIEPEALLDDLCPCRRACRTETGSFIGPPSVTNWSRPRRPDAAPAPR